MDFEKSIDDILKVIPHERRTYLFSATMTKKIEISSVSSTVESLMQQYLLIPAKQKACALVYLLMKMPEYTSMVFTRTCAETEILALMLRFLGFRAMHFNGNMTQVKRLGALNKFKAGDCNILVCTNAAGRGLDISSVDLVIVYDVPAEQEDYIHWVGRTARAGKSGLAIALVTEYSIGNYYRIEQETGKQLPTYPVEKEEMLLLYERVSVARRIADKKYKESGGKKSKEYDDLEETKYLPKKSSKKLKKIKRPRPY
uniref:Helicase C-terminal domain-containing protein n=1 Tax=Chenopodium quinoa TaxID=63459 RepID=A0A803LZD3_CHEQI